jgi:hypothetical protein
MRTGLPSSIRTFPGLLAAVLALAPACTSSKGGRGSSPGPAGGALSTGSVIGAGGDGGASPDSTDTTSAAGAGALAGAVGGAGAGATTPGLGGTITGGNGTGGVVPSSGGVNVSVGCAGTGPNYCGEPAKVVGSPQLGINTLWANSWYPLVPFANVFMTSRSPNAHNEWNRPVAKDADGNPTTDFSILVYEGQLMSVFVGTYKLRFTGQADLSGSAVSIRNKAYDKAANVTTADVDVKPDVGNSFMHFRNTRRQPSDGSATGLTGLYLMYPGTGYDTDIVTPHFRAATAMFGILRPMQAMEPKNPMRKWAERSRPRGGGFRDGGDSSYTGERETGLPFEMLVLMANALSKDLWLNVPYYLDADGQTKLAQLIEYGSDGDLPYTGPYGSTANAATNPRPAEHAPATWTPGTTSWYPPLRTGLHVYVELSNELWNYSGEYWGNTLQAEAVSEYNNGDPFKYGTINGSNAGYLRLGRHGRLHIELAERFFAVVGQSGWGDRYRMALASQIDWTDVYQGTMLYIATVYGGHKKGEGMTLGPLVSAEDGTKNSYGNPAWPANRWVHYLSGAPYIAGGTAAEQAATLVSKVTRQIDTFKSTCDLYGVKMSAYEGGTEKAAGYTDAGLRNVVYDELHYWFNKGGADAHFVYFGIAENQGFGLGPTVFDIDPTKWPKWAGIKAVYDELAPK